MELINQQQMDPGQMELYTNSQPGLTAGSYQITVTQSLPNAATDNFSTSVTQSFVVEGPQFVIDSAEIHAMFPPANANGDYGLALPFVVLRSAGLPWERLITSDKTIPWVALLIFQSDEVSLDPATNSPLIGGSVQSFLAPEEGVVKPAIDAEQLPPAVLTRSMNSIRITTDVFTAVLPRLVELSSLAHVRQIDAELQAVTESGPEEIFSIVAANRFPKSESEAGQNGATNFVHLVSLEGLSNWLVDQPAWPQGAKFVQLASLAAWRFVSIPQPGQTFADLAGGLVEQGLSNPGDLLLRLPAGSNAPDRLQDGFTALSYHTLPGTDTFAWYRGPFVPFPAKPLPAGIAKFEHAAQAMIYDQANAIFDNSYAAAWNIGRMTALADPVFLNALRGIRARMGALNAKLLERSKLPHLQGLTLAELASPGVTRKYFVRRVSEGLAGALTESFAAPAANGRLPSARMLTHSSLFPHEDLPPTPAQQARWFIGKREVSAFLLEQVSGDMPPLADWLAKLALLYGIPFNHLVPDQRMLPAESIRFFFVDPGWIKVLLDGALSIGINSGREEEAHKIIAPSLLGSCRQRISQVRRHLLRRKPSVTAEPQLPAAGMLLRSALVSGTPGLEVNPGPGVATLRMDRLSPDILLALWDQIPSTVSLSQPSQGIVFGVQQEGQDKRWIIAERSLSGDIGKATGKNFPASGDLRQYLRPMAGNIGGGVLNLIPVVKGTNGYLIPALSGALSQTSDLTSAQFSLEMIMAPQRVQWNPKV
ncbi:MAG TPA: hypothetical protein VK670_16925 [Silvibacterium sp.]|nr:hypothetical protein [Silvibacterium sp.]